MDKKEFKNRVENSGSLPTLNRFGINITEKYRQSKDFAPILARELETREVLGIITQRYKNNSILVGEAGTGKTAIVEGLAQLLAISAVPDSIKGFDLWELDIPALSNKDISDGGYHFRIKKIIEEVKKAKNIILFVDETHVILDKESELDAGDLIKPALARGELRMIASTTDWEFHKYIEQDKALVRRFQKCTIQELNRESTIRILKSRKRALEAFHGVTISTKAIVSNIHNNLLLYVLSSILSSTLLTCPIGAYLIKTTNETASNTTISLTLNTCFPTKYSVIIILITEIK